MGLSELIEKLNNSYLAWSVFAAGKLSDYSSTIYCLKNNSTLEERNPVAAYLVEELGLYSGIVTHSLVVTSLTVGCYLLFKHYHLPKINQLRNLVPYGVGISGIAGTINNLIHII